MIGVLSTLIAGVGLQCESIASHTLSGTAVLLVRSAADSASIVSLQFTPSGQFKSEIRLKSIPDGVQILLSDSGSNALIFQPAATGLRLHIWRVSLTTRSVDELWVPGEFGSVCSVSDKGTVWAQTTISEETVYGFHLPKRSFKAVWRHRAPRLSALISPQYGVAMENPSLDGFELLQSNSKRLRRIPLDEPPKRLERASQAQGAPGAVFWEPGKCHFVRSPDGTVALELPGVRYLPDSFHVAPNSNRASATSFSLVPTDYEPQSVGATGRTFSSLCTISEQGFVRPSYLGKTARPIRFDTRCWDGVAGAIP